MSASFGTNFVGDGVALGVGDGVALGVGDGVALGVALAVGTGVALGVGEGLGVAGARSVSLLQINFLPFFTHLNCEPFTTTT
jgi:hypothetical protein